MRREKAAGCPQWASIRLAYNDYHDDYDDDDCDDDDDDGDDYDLLPSYAGKGLAYGLACDEFTVGYVPVVIA